MNTSKVNRFALARLCEVTKSPNGNLYTCHHKHNNRPCETTMPKEEVIRHFYFKHRNLYQQSLKERQA